MGQVIHPSPVRYKDIDLSWMVGQVITQVSFHEPTQWSFVFGPESGIGVECLWRIVEHDRVVLTGEDHGHQFGLPTPVDAVAKSTVLIVGHRIAAVQLREATADILIEFSGGLRLEIIPTSSGYESWQLRDPFGASYFAQGGGQICRWKP
jgi:hypothetical protein